MTTSIFAGPAPMRRTWIAALPFLTIIFVFAGQIATALPLKKLGLITRDNFETYPHILYFLTGPFLMFSLFIFLWVRFFERGSLTGLGVRGFDIRQWITGGLLGLLCAGAVVTGVRLLGGYAPEAGAEASFADLGPILVLLAAFMLQATAEEFLFRGWLFARIGDRYGIKAGIAGNAVLFALMHVIFAEDPFDMSAVALISITTSILFSVFASLYVLRHGSIWGAGAWHATWNWMYITCFGLPTTGLNLGLKPLLTDYSIPEGTPGWLSGGAEGPEASIVCALVLLAASAILAMRKR